MSTLYSNHAPFRFVALGIVGLFIGVTGWATPASAQSGTTPQSDPAPGTAAESEKREAIDPEKLAELRAQLTEELQQYETQLQAILRTRFPEEQAFVGTLVWMIQEEELPKDLVDGAWLWVRKNRPTTKYPFIYFERVVRAQAERVEIVLPDFDREIYSQARLIPGLSGLRR